MKPVRILVIVLCVYVGIVIAFESMIGVFQPAGETTLVITTTDEDGNANGRVVSRLDSDGQLYVAANHWPRAWYNQALGNPEVQVTLDGEEATYQAVPVIGEEHDRVGADNSLPIAFRVLTGFPPRYFLRLDPRLDAE
jgi:hypothetical protein